ncbi:MAG: energy-coupled thiamine transporter ThiT [Christensenellaceae bacterium]|jgi:thiamine transporter|nr:energy-coupled thiamine transporter ThiT [Christensenellaceae bacterium]
MLEQTIKMLVYLTSAVLVVIIGVGIFVNYRKKEQLPAFGKYATGIAIGFSLATGAILMFQSWTEIEMGTWGVEARAFYPILALFLFAIALIIAGVFIAQLKNKILKPYTIASFASVGIYVIILLIVNPFRRDDGSEYTSGEMGGMIGFVVFATLLLIFTPFLLGKKTSDKTHTKSVVYGAVCIALSFALSYIKLFSMPLGGSITFAGLLPLILYSFMFGIRKGVVAGVISGTLQFIQEPYFLDTWQFLLEYPLAFGMIGLAGVFKEIKLFKQSLIPQFVLGSITVGILRFFCHFVAGVFVWNMYTPSEMSNGLYSFFYNAPYVFVDIAITMVAGCLLLASKNIRSILNEINKTVVNERIEAPTTNASEN